MGRSGRQKNNMASAIRLFVLAFLFVAFLASVAKAQQATGGAGDGQKRHQRKADKSITHAVPKQTRRHTMPLSKACRTNLMTLGLGPGRGRADGRRSRTAESQNLHLLFAQGHGLRGSARRRAHTMRTPNEAPSKGRFAMPYRIDNIAE